MSIYPVIRCEDARAAIDFYCEAYGFERLEVHVEEGQIVHAELRYGEGVIMPSDRTVGMQADHGPSWTYVAVEDADAHHARAKAAGAEIVRELEDQDYGSRDYSSKDPWGNMWSFGTYKPALER